MGCIHSFLPLAIETLCHICDKVMMKPMIIECGHSYCHSCIVGMFEKTQNEISSSLETLRCPQCRVPFQKESVRPNKQLQSIIETIMYCNNNLSCEKHKEKFQLFCEDDRELICWRCERTPEHEGHRTSLVEEVRKGYEEKLQNLAEKLTDMDNQCEKLYVYTKEQITQWKENIEKQRQTIQSDFQNFHHFLFEEEKSYLSKLEKEKEETLRKLQDNGFKLEKQRYELTENIQEIERKLNRSEHYLLQDVQDTIKRSSAMELDLPDDVSLVVQTMCDISTLHFDANKS